MDWDDAYIELDGLSAEQFEDEEWEFRLAQIKRVAASDWSDDKKFPALRDALNDPEPSVRYAGVMGLVQIELPEATETLIYALSDSYEWVRIRAIEGLGARQARDAVDPFVKYLEQSADEPKVRATLVKHLGSFREEHLIPIIASYLTDPDARVRANAIEGLGYYPKENVLHILEPFIDDDNVRIRANVAVILSRYGVSVAEGALDSMVHSDDAFQRVGALYSMGELRKDEFIGVLCKALSDPSALVQKNAVDALSKFGVKIQGHLLKEIRLSKNSAFILGAVKVLGVVGDKKSIKTLIKLMDSGDGELRAAAEESVDEILQRVEGDQ